MITIKELKEKKKFIIESWTEDGKRKDGEYTFTIRFKPGDSELFISGDVFGEKEREILNAEEVLFHVAKGWNMTVKLRIFSFEIQNPKIRFLEGT